MRLISRFSLGACALVLMACGGNEPAPSAEAVDDGSTEILADQGIGPETVQATATLGQFEGTVPAIAMWQHPTISFRSGVLAANGDAGLYMIPIQGGEPTSVEGNFSGGLAVGYTDEAAIAAAYDSDMGGVRIFAIDPETLDLTQFAFGTTSDGAKALCFVGTTLVRIADDGAVYRHQVSVNGDSVVLTVASVPRLTASTCAGGGALAYLLSENGRVIPLAADGSVSESLSSPRGTIALAAFPTEGETQLLFAQESGTLSLGDKVMLLADGAGPLALKQLAAGGGNFGGSYRNGILGYVSTENDLGLVSWLAVTNAAGIDAPSISLQGLGSGFGGDLQNERRDADTIDAPELSPMQEEKLDGFRAPPPSD